MRVKRYEIGEAYDEPIMVEDLEGEYVSYDDILASERKVEELTNLLQLCVNDMYKSSGKISKPTARKLLSACQRESVEFPQ